MQHLNIVLASLGSIVVLFILVKLMGNREIAQMSMFDYVNSITIGSIAAEMATSLEGDFLKPLLAMAVYTASVILLEIISRKSLRCRRFIEGRTLILMDNGKIFNRNLKRARLSVNEFLMQCRMNGYFNLSDIQTAVLEPNGRVSILPAAEARSVMPKDLQLSPPPDKLVINVVLEGVILRENLKHTGNNETWLKKQLQVPLGEIVLATCDANNQVTVYKKQNKADKRDQFDI